MNGVKLTTLLVIGTDCTGRCKSNYHTITTAPEFKCNFAIDVNNVKTLERFIFLNSRIHLILLTLKSLKKSYVMLFALPIQTSMGQSG